MQIKDKIEWKEEDESDNFGVIFLIPQDEIRYLMDAIEYSLELPKMKFNGRRYQKLQSIRKTLKDYSK
jgi:hypothetical protein